KEWLTGTMNRRSGIITQFNTAREEMAKWRFVRGWPTKWEMAEFDASKSELAIETLEIAHEGLARA
ncbi:MAG: phage tail protein, partial [Sulfurifustis sp.]